MTYAIVAGLFVLVIGSVVWLVVRGEKVGESRAEQKALARANEKLREVQRATNESVEDLDPDGAADLLRRS